MTAEEALDWLASQGSEAERAALARYGIPGDRAFGVPMGRLLAWAKRRPKDAGLAAALWADGRHEARMLAILTDDPAALTPDRMDAMVAGMSDWAICDTAAFHLFDRAPHAWGRIGPWCGDGRLYVRRSGLALI